jgi:hypothetical protein
MQNATRKIKKIGKQMQSVGKGFSAGLTLPLLAFGGLALKSFDDQEKAIAQLNAGLQSTGRYTDELSKKLQEQASVLQENSLFGDEEILQGSTAQILTFTNIATNEIGRVNQVVADLSTRLKVDLKSSALQVGKALNDPVANLSALSRSGIQFSKDQKAMINSLVKTNQLAKAQDIILGELENQYGGSAKAAAEAGAGWMKQLSNSIGDLTEDFGRIINEGIKPFGEKIKGLVSRLKELSPETKKNIVLFGAIAAAVGPVLVVLGFLMTSVVPGLITAFGYLRASLLLLQTGFLKLTVIIASNPFGALAVAIAAVASYFIFFNNKVDDTIDKQNLLADVNDKAARSIANEKAKLAELLFIARDESIVKSARIKAVKELNKLSPKFLGNLTLEKINTDAATASIKLYNQELLKTAKTKAAQEKLQALESKIIDLELASEKASIKSAKAVNELRKNAVSLEDQLKLRAIEKVGISNKTTDIYTVQIKKLKEQGELLLKIIGASQTLNEVTSTKPTATGRKKASVVDTTGLAKGVQTFNLSDGLILEAQKLDTVLTGMTERFSFFQENADIFTNAVGASFFALGGQIASVFETGNSILDSFVGSIINSLAELAASFMQQLLLEKLFTSAKKIADFGKASSSGIVIATSAAAAMGPLGIVALPGLIASTLATVGTAFAGIAGFQNGGVVGGSSFTGDKLFARINSGEMVLNQKQQGNLLGMLNPAGNNVNVVLQPSIDFSGRKFKLMLNQVESALNKTR